MDPLTEYTAYSVPMTQVWVAPDFNCRGMFTPESIQTLAKSIRDDGLKYPVYVQSWDKNPGYKYRLVAGFRRFSACRLLHMEEIPAILTEDDMSEFEAHKLNLLENLERQDLNVLEEAKGIALLFPCGESMGEIAKELNRPRPWIYRRLGLLDLPHEVQLMCASGRLAQRDLDILLAYRNDPVKALETAQELLKARGGSDQGKIYKTRNKLKKGRRVPDTKRTKAEIADMIGLMFRYGVNGLPTRVAAWCAGTISTEGLMEDLEEEKEKIMSDCPSFDDLSNREITDGH